MTIDHNAQPGADGRRWQSWHLRFPCYQLRLAKMAQHARTEEFAKGLGRLAIHGLVPTEAESRLDAWLQG